MSPALISLIISLVEEAITEAPQIVADLESIFALPNPSPADWEALRQKVLAKSYADYVPASALAPGTAVAESPAAITLDAASNPPINEMAAPETASAAAASAYLADGTPNPSFPG
ncbi:MAG: hypothetical protein ACRED1_06370 [Limisphaerales bacterium]